MGSERDLLLLCPVELPVAARRRDLSRDGIAAIRTRATHAHKERKPGSRESDAGLLSDGYGRCPIQNGFCSLS